MTRSPQRLAAALLVCALCAGLALMAGAGQPSPGGGPKGEKRHAWQMKAVPWSKVFQWLADQTGLPVVGDTGGLTGTFTFTPPASAKPRLYTVAEIVDTLNRALLPRKHVLIRRPDGLVLLAANVRLDPELCPLVSPASLAKRGRTEIVHMVLLLKAVAAKDVLPVVKSLLGPFGEATPAGNRLLLRDAVGNLRLIVEAVAELDEGETGTAVLFSHRCVHVLAAVAGQKLEQLLGASTSIGKGKPGLALALDPRTNTVHLRGAAEQIAQAKELLARLDVAVAGSPPLLLGPPFVQGHAVPGEYAEIVAVALQKLYPALATKIVPAGNQILVMAGPEEQIAIARDLQKALPPMTTVVLPLTGIDAARVERMLRSTETRGRYFEPFIEADTATNTLIVRGFREQIEAVQDILRTLGENRPAQGEKVQTFTIEGGGARALAEAVQKMLARMRPQTPVRLILPGEGPAPKPVPRPKEGAGAKKEAGKTAKTGVTITVLGNRLTVTGDDPQALALVQELVRLDTAPAGGQGDWEVIRLRHATAGAAAKVLDEMFNGPPVGARRSERARILADPSINALLVRATPLDTLTIRRLVEKELDVEGQAADVVLKTYVLGPFKHVGAAEMGKNLQTLYRDAIKANKLAVAVDERTRTLILRTTPPLHKEIRRLVDMLELFAATQKK